MLYFKSIPTLVFIVAVTAAPAKPFDDDTSSISILDPIIKTNAIRDAPAVSVPVLSELFTTHLSNSDASLTNANPMVMKASPNNAHTDIDTTTDLTLHPAHEALTAPNPNVPTTTIYLWHNMTDLYYLLTPTDSTYHMVPDLECHRVNDVQHTYFLCNTASVGVIAYAVPTVTDPGTPPPPSCTMIESMGLAAVITPQRQESLISAIGFQKLVSVCCGPGCHRG